MIDEAARLYWQADSLKEAGGVAAPLFRATVARYEEAAGLLSLDMAGEAERQHLMVLGYVATALMHLSETEADSLQLVRDALAYVQAGQIMAARLGAMDLAERRALRAAEFSAYLAARGAGGVALREPPGRLLAWVTTERWPPGRTDISLSAAILLAGLLVASTVYVVLLLHRR